MEIKNYGLNWELEKAQQSEKDWFFGAGSPVCLAEIPSAERESCLPKGEVQRSDKGDMMDCASRGPVNIVETKLNWLIKNKKLSERVIDFLEDKGYINEAGEVELADAWIAIESGTTKNGNSMKAPLETLRKKGILPKKFLPLEKWMTWDDYHDSNRITEEMKRLAKESLRYLNFNYEKVLESQMERMLDRDILNLAGYAWPVPVNGEYPRVDDPPNHVFMGLRLPKYYIFDNYIDYVDGDFIKKLTPDYDFHRYGYRIIISENTNPDAKKSSWQWFWGLIKKLIDKFFNIA